MSGYYEGPWHTDKVRDKRGQWWWVVRQSGQRRCKRIGPCDGDRRRIDYFRRTREEVDRRNAEWRKANGADAEHEYTFDLTLVAAITVRAKTITEAKVLVEAILDDAVTCSIEHDGERYEFEASREGEADLGLIDGEAA